jgi:hypothetical protein
MDQDQPFENITPLPEGGPWTFVPVSSDLAVPKRFIAEGSDFKLEIEVGDDGNGRAIAIEVRPRSGGVTSENLRHLPITRLTRQAVAGAAQRVEPGKVGGHRLLEAMLTRGRSQAESDAAFYRAYTKDARRPRSGSPLTDDNLRSVADLYRAAIERGDPPTQTVSDEMHVARSTAARWVAEARKRRFLGPAIRGRAGEQSESPGAKRSRIDGKLRIKSASL